MFWIEWEPPTLWTWPELLVLLGSWFVGGNIAWWWDEWLLGDVAAAVGTLVCFGYFRTVFRLHEGIREALALARSEFQQRYPTEHIKDVALRAVEPERFVFSIRSRMGNPQPRRYFGVSRMPPDVVEELPRRDWWPRGLK